MRSLRWVLLIITLSLLAMYFFRWEEGVTQKEKDIILIHKKDRWANQSLLDDTLTSA